MEEEKIKEIIKIVEDIINEFGKSEVNNILKEMPEEELKVLNPFKGFHQKGVVNYKKFFQLALEIENYAKVNWEQFNSTILELASRIYDRDQTAGSILRDKVVIKLNKVEELIEK